MGVSTGDFDTRWDCLGFMDGVYDFEKSKLVRGQEAKAYYVTKTVGYEYGDMMGVGDEEMAGFDTFF